MKEFMQKYLQDITNICNSAQEVLDNWDFKKNLEFPTLIEEVAKKQKMSKSHEVKEIDNTLRSYIQRHDVYISKKGAKGGITLKSKEADRLNKLDERAKAKKEIMATLDAEENI